MQRIVCCFLFVFKNACVSSSVKNSPSPLVSLAVLHCQTSWRGLTCCLCTLTAHRWALHSPALTLCSVGSQLVNGVTFFSVCVPILLCLCNIHTTEQPFLDRVCPPLKIVSSAITVASLLLKTYLQMCSQIPFSGCFIISSLEFLSHLTSYVVYLVQNSRSFSYLLDISPQMKLCRVFFLPFSSWSNLG